MNDAALIWSYLASQPLLWLTATLAAYWLGDAVFRASGRPLSSYAAASSAGRPAYRFLAVSVERERSELYRRIDERARAMFAAGLPAEVESLRAAGYGPDAPGLRAIGYREFFLTDAELSAELPIRPCFFIYANSFGKRMSSTINTDGPPSASLRLFISYRAALSQKSGSHVLASCPIPRRTSL